LRGRGYGFVIFVIEGKEVAAPATRCGKIRPFAGVLELAVAKARAGEKPARL